MMVAWTRLVALEGERSSWLEILYVGETKSISRPIIFKEYRKEKSKMIPRFLFHDQQYGN